MYCFVSKKSVGVKSIGAGPREYALLNKVVSL
jgi:hypothetical protein